MNIAVTYPPLENGKGVPLLGQNRQFQWFNSPTYIYPMVPAYAATYLKEKGFLHIQMEQIIVPCFQKGGHGQYSRGQKKPAGHQVLEAYAFPQGSSGQDAEAGRSQNGKQVHAS